MIATMRAPLIRALPVLAAVALVVTAGLVRGQWGRGRAGLHAVDEAVARLKGVPLDLGDWRGHPLELDPGQLAVGEIAGYLTRRYEDPLGGGAVTVLIVCGRPGPISVHTPDVCYAGAGYEPTGPPDARSLPVAPSRRPGEFFHAVFAKRTAAGPVYLRILWSWSASGAWEAPANPRFTFASRPVLYKMYLIREMAAPQERLEDDPSLRLLQALSPELERTVFAAPRADGR